MKFNEKFLVELSDSIIWNIIQDFGNDRLSIDDCCDKIVDYVLEVAKNSDYEVEKNSEELEVYKQALELACELISKCVHISDKSIDKEVFIKHFLRIAKGETVYWENTNHITIGPVNFNGGDK